MMTFKRIDGNTLLIEKVYYTTNILKRTEIKGESGFLIDSVKINGIFYYPYKESKK